MNVLESLHLVSRVAKNQYGWHGRHSLPKTLRNLQRLGEEQKYEEQMAHLQQKELDLMDYKFGERRRDGCPESQDPQLLDFSEPDYPSCESTVPTRVMAGRGRWCLLKRVTAKNGKSQMDHPGGRCPLILSPEDRETDGFPTGLPTRPH